MGQSELVELIEPVDRLIRIMAQQLQQFAGKLQVSGSVGRHDASVSNGLCLHITGGMGVPVATPLLQLIQAVSRMTNLIEQALFGHPGSCIADGSHDHPLLNGLLHDGHQGICHRSIPTVSSDQNQGGYGSIRYRRHCLERIVRQQTESAHRTDRIQGGSHHPIHIVRGRT